METPNDLVTVASSSFREGMYVESPIYAGMGSSFILLCENTVLTAKIMDQIEHYSLNGSGTYVSKDYYQKLANRTGQFSPVQGKSPAQVSYNKTRYQFSQVLDVLVKGQALPLDTIDTLSMQIKSQLDTCEEAMVVQCVNAMRKSDEYLFTHSVNVALLNGLLSKWAGLELGEQHTAIQVGLLHDLGKLQIPAEILNKPSRLSDEEYALVKQHSQHSYQELVDAGITDSRVLYGVRWHHEKTNGQGYPDGLTMGDINVFARITAISDIYDAMVAKRVYKAPVSPFDVLASFAKDRFSSLDITLANIFIRRISLALTGKKVLLSNGVVGEIAYVSLDNIGFPIVRTKDGTIQTNEILKCASMAL